MPMRNDVVSVLVDGTLHDTWTRYEIDSDLLIPADAWRVDLALPHGELPPVVQPGASAEVRLGDDTVMRGMIDDVADDIDKHARRLTLTGRDGAAVLVDCSAPVFVARQIGLAEIMANIVKPLGIARTRIDADATRIRDKVNVEPGDTAWDALVHAAEANGLWPWFEPDGTLVVGGPDYSRSPVARLVMNYDDPKNNLLRLARTRSVAEWHSEYTVLGQAHGTMVENGRHAIKSVVKDTGIAVYRPRVVVDCDADSVAATTARGRKLLSDSRLKGFTLTATVRGHRTADGVLWQPGQRVEVKSTPQGIEGIFFLMARKFEGGRGVGAVTTLTLKEDGVWVLDAHPHTRAHRRGKNATAGEIVDVSGY